MPVHRAALLAATACLFPLSLDRAPAATPSPGSSTRRPAAAHPAPVPGDVIQSIRIEGNQRIEDGTILSYMLVQPGDRFDPDALDRSLKALYATGLFRDVSLHRDGGTLVVHVVENPIVNRIAFEGNHKLSDDQLNQAIQLRSRAVFTPEAAEADRQRLLDLYAKRGRYAATVTPQIIRLPQNRVDVVFEIHEGSATLLSRIAFVGNHAFSETRLREVISSRQEAFWRILSTSDYYDPERVKFDEELLRRFYLKHGYADFRVQNATAELSPDRGSFFLTFTLHEGERYRIGKVSIASQVKKLTPAQLRPLVQVAAGDWYDGDAVERSSQAIEDWAQNHGIPFIEVRPRIARNRQKHTVDLVFDVVQGPRVYVERIDITGNTRTEDKVIRREFQLAEGDAYNAAAIRHTRQRLQDLGYFSQVNITTTPGSAPDRSIVTANVDEKATGELTIGGGYSTDAGALLDLGLRERNLIGTGIDAGINGVLAQKESQIDLSVTDPYFLDRNLVTGFDIFHVQNNNQDIAQYSERRTGFDIRLGYQFNDHLSQAWTYSLVDRNVYDVQSGASLYIVNQQGPSTLSQIGQTLTLDYRDSKVDPHTGFVVRAGSDFAGLGGNADYIRGKIDGAYYIPLDRFTGNSDWDISLSAGTGYLWQLGGKVEKIIDRFFLGGDNLRGFESGGAGPHDATTGDSLGGRFIWTQSTELHFPLPISPDLGLSGRAFVDVGSLSVVNEQYGPVYDNPAPRVGVGVGVSWRSPFGLINIDIADPVVKYKYDQTQIFRFGFGTRF
ncbi:MAG TPA: outer membrane protein assembly factor BamA [Acetobacteraceae bacterium]|nr:outer membrane protein assembly factor BamA [Acetobacteraceae bacterium]